MKTETDVKEALRRQNLILDHLVGRTDELVKAPGAQIDRNSDGHRELARTLNEAKITETAVEVLTWILKDDEEALTLL
jgi:hypothetical protein